MSEVFTYHIGGISARYRCSEKLPRDSFTPMMAIRQSLVSAFRPYWSWSFSPNEVRLKGPFVQVILNACGRYQFIDHGLNSHANNRIYRLRFSRFHRPLSVYKVMPPIAISCTTIFASACTNFWIREIFHNTRRQWCWLGSVIVFWSLQNTFQRNQPSCFFASFKNEPANSRKEFLRLVKTTAIFHCAETIYFGLKAISLSAQHCRWGGKTYVQMILFRH